MYVLYITVTTCICFVDITEGKSVSKVVTTAASKLKSSSDPISEPLAAKPATAAVKQKSDALGKKCYTYEHME